MHEASLREQNCMVTLTYDNEHLPERGSLDRRAFPLFMKRLRKRIEPERVRYFHAGEYGERFKRPHYHALLFGFDFGDKVLAGRRGDFPVWSSVVLSGLWAQGRCEIGTVSFESAAYVARYVVKKLAGDELAAHVRVDLESGDVVELEPEYCTMSRNKGIGFEWFRRYGGEVYPSDGVVCRGQLVKPPRFYDSQFELESPEVFDEVRKSRRLKRSVIGNNLVAGEVNAVSRLSLKRRELE